MDLKMKSKICYVSDLETISEVTWELLYLHTHLSVSEHGARVGFPAKYFPKERVFCPSKPHSFHSVNSAIGSRMNGMIFRSFMIFIHDIPKTESPKRTQIPSILSIPIPE